MPKGRQCRILQKLTCLMCANLSGETFFKKWLFSKWLKTMLTRQISLLRSICRQYCAQIFFLSMIHVETRSQYQVCFILGMYVGRLVGRHLYVSWRGPYFNKKIFESSAKSCMAYQSGRGKYKYKRECMTYVTWHIMEA